jgi:CheY-like chemotaxis protein
VIETRDVVLDDEYRRTHPRVTPGRYVRISVHDTGHGMSPDVLQKVFEPYFTTKGERGTGLGLANVYWIVQHAGGHIDVTSAPGSGTTFTIHFPHFDAASDGMRASTTPSRKHGEVRNAVLLVEDDAEAVAHLETSLARLGFRVLTARTPGQAAEVLRQHVAEVALVVTDVLLPGMNGLELSRELRAVRGGLPVLFVAGDTGGILAERGIAGDRVEFMPRLSPLPLLSRRVKEALERKVDVTN